MAAANPLPLVALYTDDIVPASSAAMTNEDALNPASNAVTNDPAALCKSTTTSTTITLTTASKTIVAVALIQTNATVASLNGQGITLPTAGLDGARVHGWLDLRGAPLTDTTWDIALSVPSGVVFIGRIVLVQALHDLPVQYGLELSHTRPGDIQIKTRMGSDITNRAEIKVRSADGTVDLVTAATLMKSVDAAAQGFNFPFLFIPDEETNDAWFVKLKSVEFKTRHTNVDVNEVPVSFIEVSSGPPNG
jgi:hypothetical protein